MAHSCPNDHHLDKRQQTNNFFFSAINAPPPPSIWTPSSAVCYSEEHLITTKTSIFAKYYKPMYKIRLSYDLIAAFMRTFPRLLDTEACINQFNPIFLPSQGTNRINRVKIPHLCTATQELLCMEKLYTSTSDSETYALEHNSVSMKILSSICIVAPLLLNALYAESFQTNVVLFHGTPIWLQSSQTGNAISIFLRAHHMSLRILSNRLTATRLAHTQFVSHDGRYSNSTEKPVS